MLSDHVVQAFRTMSSKSSSARRTSKDVIKFAWSISLLCPLMDVADKDLTSYLTHSHPDVFLLMNNQPHTLSRQEDSNCQPHLERNKEIRRFSVALRWPHRSQRVSISKALGIFD